MVRWRKWKDNEKTSMKQFFLHKQAANRKIITSKMMIRLTTMSKDNGAWMKDMAFVKRGNQR